MLNKARYQVSWRKASPLFCRTDPFLRHLPAFLAVCLPSASCTAPLQTCTMNILLLTSSGMRLIRCKAVGIRVFERFHLKLSR